MGGVNGAHLRAQFPSATSDPVVPDAMVSNACRSASLCAAHAHAQDGIRNRMPHGQECDVMLMDDARCEVSLVR